MSSSLIRLALGSACLALLIMPSAAQNRPDTRQMTCEQVQSLINQNGAVVLTTGRYTYDRYVAHGGHCLHPYVPRLATAPTRDDAMCTIGYECINDPEIFETFGN